MAIEISEPTTPDTQDRLIAKRDHSRDDSQVWVDGKVKDLVNRYHEAGDPAPSDTAPYLRLEVVKAQRPDLRRAINRAFSLISSGDAVPNLVPAFYIDGKGTDGKVVVKFNVQPAPATKAEREKAEKAEKDQDAADAAATEDGAAKTPTVDPNEIEAPEEAPKPGRFARR